jgi:hypothetical protein
MGATPGAGRMLRMDFGHDDLSRHFGRIWPVHVDQFTTLLIALRKQFGGDLDRMLVLAVIGSRTLPARRMRQLSYADFEAGLTAERPSLINTQSIAETTGIPRETVRRKVAALMEAGWVERNEDGSLLVSVRAREELAPGTEATFRYLVAVGAACVAAAGADRQ